MSILLPAAIEIPRVRCCLALMLAAAALAPGAVLAQDDSSLPTLSIANITVAENTGSVSVTVTLSADSSEAVTVAYRTIDGTAKKDDGDYSLTDGTLTIAARSRIGRIRATIRDDDVDENSETFKIQLSNPSNAAFAGDNSTIESTVTITDNDTRGVRVGPTTLRISEGWTNRYSVALGSEPTGTVTVTPSVSGSSDVTVSGALTFTTGNWNRAQQVTVTAGYDADTVDDSATISHTVTGGDYGSVAAASVSVTAEDYLTTSTALVLGGTSAVEESGGAQTVTVTGTRFREFHD